MADTTLAAIMRRFRVVLEGEPLFLRLSPDAFSIDVVPNDMLEDVYHVSDDGIARQTPMGNYRAARIDRVVVNVARKISFQAQDASEAMHDVLNTIERRIKADGPNQSYHAEVQAREVRRVPETDIILATLTFGVDYDFNEATT